MRILAVLVLALFLVVAPVYASCQQQEGVIVRLEDGRVVVIAMDHYGAAKKGHAFEEKTLKIVDDAVYVLDGRIVPREMALRPGRRFYAQGSSKGCFFVACLSEAATDLVGTLTRVTDGEVTLAIPHGPATEELAVPFGDDLAIVDGSAGDLIAGARVRITPARPLTVDVLTPEARRDLVAESVPAAADGILVRVEREGGLFTLLDPSSGTWSEFSQDRKRPPQTTLQCRFQGRSARGLEPEARMCYIGYWKRANKMDRFAIVLGADPGRVEGIVARATADGLDLTLPDGAERSVEPGGATVLVDGRPGELAAVPVGSHAFVFAARRQTVHLIGE